MSKIRDLKGQKFGRLTVLGIAERYTLRTSRHAKWHTRCDCGTLTTVYSDKLVNGHTKSCGCLFKEYHRKRRGKTHGIAATYYAGCRCSLCKDAAKAYRKRKMLAVRQYIQEAKSRPCTDCKQSFPWYCMDLDHIQERGPKKFMLSQYRHLNLNLKQVTEEIAKCEVVCAVCHRKRTQTRYEGWPKESHS